MAITVRRSPTGSPVTIPLVVRNATEATETALVGERLYYDAATTTAISAPGVPDLDESDVFGVKASSDNTTPVTITAPEGVLIEQPDQTNLQQSFEYSEGLGSMTWQFNADGIAGAGWYLLFEYHPNLA